MTPITPDALSRVERDCRERIDALARLLTQRMDASDKALTLQAVEYDRRLLDLNNAHAKATDEKTRTDQAALKVQENSVTKEHLSSLLSALDQKVNDLRESRSKGTGRDDMVEKTKALHKWVIGLAVSTGLALVLFLAAQVIAFVVRK